MLTLGGCGGGDGDVQTDASPDGIYHSCPAAPPEGGTSCSPFASCEYGTESCCSETFPSLVCDCDNERWTCYYTDACLIPACTADAAPPDASPFDAGVDGSSG